MTTDSAEVHSPGRPVHDRAYYQGILTAQYIEKSKFTLVHYDVIDRKIVAYAWYHTLYLDNGGRLLTAG